MELKTILEALDKGNKNFYSNLSDDEKKEISPWVLMRYMSSGTKYPEHSLLMVNDLVNVDFSSLKNHPELAWKILSLCGVGIKDFHPWIAPGKKQQKNKLQEALCDLYPEKKIDEIDLIIEINSRDDLVEIFMMAGYQDKDLLALFEK